MLLLKMCPQPMQSDLRLLNQVSALILPVLYIFHPQEFDRPVRFLSPCKPMAVLIFSTHQKIPSSLMRSSVGQPNKICLRRAKSVQPWCTCIQWNPSPVLQLQMANHLLEASLGLSHPMASSPPCQPSNQVRFRAQQALLRGQAQCLLIPGPPSARRPLSLPALRSHQCPPVKRDHEQS